MKWCVSEFNHNELVFERKSKHKTTYSKKKLIQERFYSFLPKNITLKTHVSLSNFENDNLAERGKW